MAVPHFDHIQIKVAGLVRIKVVIHDVIGAKIRPENGGGMTEANVFAGGVHQNGIVGAFAVRALGILADGSAYPITGGKIVVPGVGHII